MPSICTQFVQIGEAWVRGCLAAPPHLLGHMMSLALGLGMWSSQHWLSPPPLGCYVWGCSGQHRSRAFSWLSLFASFAQRGEPIPPISVGQVAMNQSHMCAFVEKCLLALT